jgi:hypothetical protein
MNAIRSWSLLRQVLLVDAVCSGAMGLGLVLVAQGLAALLQLPATMLKEAGFVLIPFAAFVAWLSLRQHPGPWAVRAVIGLNIVWVADSIFLLFTDWMEPNALGYAFVIGQAVVVGLFAALEYMGLREQTRHHYGRATPSSP